MHGKAWTISRVTLIRQNGGGVRDLAAFSGRVGCWSAKKKQPFILQGAPLPIRRHFIHTSTPNQNKTVGETENEGVEYTLILLCVTLTSTDLRML